MSAQLLAFPSHMRPESGVVRLSDLALAAWSRLPVRADPYVLWTPVGPVAQSELHLLVFSAVVMAAFVVPILLLFTFVVVRFRDRPGNRTPRLPHWRKNGWMEALWFALPAAVLLVIALPTVRLTYHLAQLPKHKRPLVIDVTSLTWKWLFEYPAQNIATVNYIDVPTGRPILFELTADSPMNTFWIPQMGGMEYTMPGRVLPLWLQVNKTGLYWGHSGQFSGLDFAQMFFDVQARSPRAFGRWVGSVRRQVPPMTMSRYRTLLRFGTVGFQTYSGFPAETFPSLTHGFTLSGGMYTPMLSSGGGMHGHT